MDRCPVATLCCLSPQGLASCASAPLHGWGVLASLIWSSMSMEQPSANNLLVWPSFPHIEPSFMGRPPESLTNEAYTGQNSETVKRGAGWNRGQKTGREILRSLAAGETRKLSEASRVSRHRSMGRYGCWGEQAVRSQMDTLKGRMR